MGMLTVPREALATIAVLLGAAGLDAVIGDPWNWLHPVQVIGWFTQQYSRLVLATLRSAWAQRLAGIGLAVLAIAGSGLVVWAGLAGLHRVSPLLAFGAEVILVAACLAGRSLRDAAQDVLAPLTQGQIETARDLVSRYVGRDTQDLNEAEIRRAVLETVTENATDAVFAPLFYAILGALLPGVGSAPLAIAYKAASTLDSMVGYRDAPYTHLGWFSARLEDVLTWLPCRLSVLCLALLSGKPLQVWQICSRDAPADPSPNSGWSEAAFAAILGVQVGGPNYYRGVLKMKPYLGNPDHAIAVSDIHQALRLMRCCFWVQLSLGCGLILLLRKSMLF
jgi:adenosylcobinamide-phosphate synthase